jgi:arsenate reductase
LYTFKEKSFIAVWAQTAATLPCEKVFCYSGGTEATELFPMAAKTLEQAGFEVRPFLKVKPHQYKWR